MRILAGSAALPALPFDEAPAAKKSGMIVRAARPEDLEMPLEFFDNYLTPAEHFFVRTHTYAPNVDAAEWRLSIGGLVNQPVTLSLADVKQLPRVDLVGVIECAGNGRGLYRPPVPGLQWKYGAVANAKWTGVRLADVLKKAGVKNQATDVAFDGADVPLGTMPDFQRSILLKKALDPNTLLAFEMNGETLPAQHGFPLRLVVPGWASDSWTKWVTSITLLDHEADGFFMKTAYRHPGKPVRPGESVPPDQMFPVTSLGVKSVIGSPVDGAFVVSGKAVRIQGAAWSGDQSPVAGVDVSVDQGRTWKPAQVTSPRTQFGWRLWTYNWTPARDAYHVIMARARTAAGDVQPLVEEWNPSGYQWNVVQRAGISVGGSRLTPEVTAAVEPRPPAGYDASCMVCHGDDVVAQQHLTRAQWEREVDKMVRWGAKVPPDRRDTIINYLVRFFGSR